MRSTDSEMSENIQKCLLVSSAVKYLSIYLHNIFQTHTHKHIQTNSLYCMLVKSPPPFGSRIYDQVKHTNCLNIVTVQFTFDRYRGSPTQADGKQDISSVRKVTKPLTISVKVCEQRQ